MIIKCLRIYNEHTKSIESIKKTGMETVGKCYQVLTISISEKRMYFRIIPDDGGHSILVRMQDYQIMSHLIPKNWVLWEYDNSVYTFSPEKWVNHDYWEESFWQDYDNDLPKALRCFEEELKIIQETDNLKNYQDPLHL